MEGETTGSEPALDLATQYEALLAAVWAAEEDWRLDDRITLSVDLEKRRRRRPAR